MTNNKLPVVGKRYKDKFGRFTVRDSESGICNIDYIDDIEWKTGRYHLDTFFEYCEELPEVVKRYKSKKGSNGIMKIVYNNGKEVVYQWPDLTLETFNIKDGMDSLLIDFEELPDQEPTERKNFLDDCSKEETPYYVEEKELKELDTTTEEPVVKNNFTTDKVQEALKELKKDLADFGEGLLDDDVDGEGFDIYSSAMELVNTLEKNKKLLAYSNQQETPVSSIPEPTSKSIWKPISELPKNCCDVVIKFTEDDICFATFSDDTNQFFMVSEVKGPISIMPPMEYARLTDFINQQETLEKRIERLEQLNRSK